jgi:lipocalin
VILDEAESRGYDTDKLIWVDQSDNIATWSSENRQ